MAEKRHSEAADTVAYSKLPRLEASSGHVLTAGVCRSSVLSGHGSDSHCNYQGTYFGYPLQCQQFPKPLAHWGPAESYASCTDGAGSQQARPEKRCMWYRKELEGFGMWVQNASSEKNKDCLVGDTLEAQQKWAQYAGHTDFIQQGWIQGFPMLHATQAPTGCSPLAAPKPVYRNHVYCAEADFTPRDSLASGMPAESPPRRPPDADWAAPPPGHQAGCGGAKPGKAPATESGFPPSHQGWKDTGAAPAGFLPYRKRLENLPGAPSGAPVDANHPAGYRGQTGVPEECARSQCPKAWPKLPTSANPLAAPPPPLIYQERSLAYHRLPSYPLTSHEQVALYPQSVAQAEKQKPLSASPACKGFDFPAAEAPQILARTYFPPSPRTYFPRHPESYPYGTLGPPPVTSPRLKNSQEPNPPRDAPSSVAFEQRSPLPACSLSERTPRCGSFPSQESAQDWPAAGGVAKPAGEGFRCPQAALWSHPFQPLHAAERLPGYFEGYGQTQEAGKGRGGEEGPSYVERTPGLRGEDKGRDGDADKAPRSGACVRIPPSPATSQDSCLKGAFRRAPVPECPDPSAQCALRPPEKEWRDLKSPAIPPPPSSPPMPVIHNVFSLAPYKEYLEGATDSVTLPPSKRSPAENPRHEKSQRGLDGKSSPRLPSAGLSETTGLVPGRGKETACNAAAESAGQDRACDCVTRERDSRGRAGLPESHRAYRSAPAVSRPDATGGVSRLAKEERVLDLSLKMEGLPDVPIAEKPAGKTEALERENGTKRREGVEGEPEALQKTDSLALPPPLQSASEEKSHFQSSTAFLYKKCKILKSHAAGTGAARRQDGSAFLSSSKIAVASDNFPGEGGCPQAATATQQNSLPVRKSCPQAATRQNSLPVQNGLPAPPVALEASARPGPQPSRTRHKRLNHKQPEAWKSLPPPAPAGSPALGEASAPLSPGGYALAQRTSSKQYFTALHTSVCALIADSVSTSSPELLREWLDQAEPEKEPRPKAAGLAKAKEGPRASEAPRGPSKSKAVWLAFKDVAALLQQVLRQLDSYLLAHACPFPHVERAGAIFVPIHVVKETLFGNLSAASVDHVLQSHKVELRPTTLSEEKHLRELELKTCTSRMLKLLALKQLPDIYPDLLDVHWHHCVRQQLSEPAEEFQNGDPGAAGAEDSEAAEGAGFLQSTTRSLSLGVRGGCGQGGKCELTSPGGAPGSPAGSPRPKSQGPSSSSCGRTHATFANAKVPPGEVTAPVARRTKPFPLRRCAKRRLFHAHRLSGALRVKLTGRGAGRARRPAKALRLPKSVVRLKLRDAVRERPGTRWKRPASLLPERFRRWRWGARHAPPPPEYPELVGKRIRHLFEEKDKTETWYSGLVLRVHEPHQNPLKTVYEVRYDCEPEWQYYLEILQDYKKGWLEVEG